MEKVDNVIELVAEPLTKESFAPYGKAILHPRSMGEPTKSADHWECWVYMGDMTPGTASLGIVTTRWTDKPIYVMEAHSVREVLMPLDKPLIQVVAEPCDIADIGARPDISTAKAFILEPGQAIVMEVGTWHYAAVPFEGEAVYYFLANRESTDPGGTPNRWIEFENNKAFVIRKD